MPQNDPVPTPAEAGASTREKLEALRRDIDRLDDAMLALVEQRVAAAMGIAELKRSETDGRLRLRPGREAAVVERLAAQAHVAPDYLVRSIWREIMAACLDLQVHNELVLHAPGQPALLTDAMRRRFGGTAEMILAAAPSEAIDAARTREAVAVIELEPASDWWVALRGDPVLAMFECLRDEDGRPIAVALGRIAAEDLKACPHIRIAEEEVAGDELLAASGSLRLLLSASPTTQGNGAIQGNGAA